MRPSGVVGHDLRHALRALLRTPGFTAVVVLCLALGTGANTAIFSLLDQVLLRNLPVRDPERLVIFHRKAQLPGSAMADNMETVFSIPMSRDLNERVRVFDGVIARSRIGVTLTGGEAQRAAAELVSGNFFNVLGVRPELGRLLESADDQPHSAHAVAVLGYGFWMRHYGGSASALNSTLRVNGVPLTVVGVVSHEFAGVMRGGDAPEIFVPLGMHGRLDLANAAWDDDRNVRFVNLIARLRPGETRDHALAGLRAVYQPIVVDELSRFEHMTARERQDLLNDQITIKPAAEGINMLRDDWERPILALAAIAGLVLLIACANISGLILARAASREKDVAVRLALGAGRSAVGRPFLFESLLVSLVGAVAGLAVAHWTIAGLLRLLPNAENGNDFLSASIDTRMLLFSLAAAVFTGFLSGFAPVLQAARHNLAESLNAQTRSNTTRRTILRRALVAGQITLCSILLVAAGLLTRTLYNISRADIGFQPGCVTVFRINPSDTGYHGARSRDFYDRLHDRLAALPGVQSVAYSIAGPYMGSTMGTGLDVDGYHERPDENMMTLTDTLSANYFSTLGAPLLAGREFTDSDRAGSPPIAIVNEAFAKKYLGANPLGRRVRFSSKQPWKEVVGVVRNTAWDNAQSKPEPFVFIPVTQEKRELTSLEWYVRARPGYQPAADIRRVVRGIDANVPVNQLGAYTVRVADAAYIQRLLAILASVFGGLATLLAALGLYGLIAWTLGQRRSEIGIRMALGATAVDVAGLIAREVGTLTLFGIVPGILVALAAGSLIASQLFGVTAHDPVVFGTATVVLLAVAALASALPTFRVLRIEPASVLRHE